MPNNQTSLESHVGVRVKRYEKKNETVESVSTKTTEKSTWLEVQASGSLGTGPFQENKYKSNVHLKKNETRRDNQKEKDGENEEELGTGISPSHESANVKGIRRSLKQLTLDVSYKSTNGQSCRAVESGNNDKKKLSNNKNRKRNFHQQTEDMLAPPDKIEKNDSEVKHSGIDSNLDTLVLDEKPKYVCHKIRKSKCDTTSSTTRNLERKFKEPEEKRKFDKTKRKIARKLKKIDEIRKEFVKVTASKVNESADSKSQQRLSRKRRSNVILSDSLDDEVTSLLTDSVLEQMAPVKKQKYSAPCNSPVNV